MRTTGHANSIDQNRRALFQDWNNGAFAANHVPPRRQPRIPRPGALRSVARHKALQSGLVMSPVFAVRASDGTGRTVSYVQIQGKGFLVKGWRREEGERVKGSA
jgi:hypothetical protein